MISICHWQLIASSAGSERSRIHLFAVRCSRGSERICIVVRSAWDPDLIGGIVLKEVR